MLLNNNKSQQRVATASFVNMAVSDNSLFDAATALFVKDILLMIYNFVYDDTKGKSTQIGVLGIDQRK